MDKRGKLSVREGETIARWLSTNKNSHIAASACRWHTPDEIAREFLGSEATDTSVETLADQIRSQLE